MKTFVYFFYLLAALASCKPAPRKLVTVDRLWLDSIQKQSDSSFTKAYRNQEFVTAEYFVDHKNKTVCQLMKDSVGRIRQIILAKRNTRLFSAEYFSNGQLKAHLPLDTSGKLQGHGRFYYEGGGLKSEGDYDRGLYSGEWVNYSETGKTISKDVYDKNGQMIKTILIQ